MTPDQIDTLLAHAQDYGGTSPATPSTGEAADALIGYVESLRQPPHESDSQETFETSMIITVEALESLPIGTVILADVLGPRIIGASHERVSTTRVLERSTLGVGDPEKPAYRAFNGARYGREWFADIIPARVIHKPQEGTS